MKRLILVGAGLTLLASGGVAMAQMPPMGGPGGQGGPGGMNQGGMNQGGGQSGPNWQQHERWEMMRRMHHHEHDHDEGAAFRFRKGDMEIGIKCGSNEPIQLCVAAASALMDKVSSMGQPSASSTNSSTQQPQQQTPRPQ